LFFPASAVCTGAMDDGRVTKRVKADHGCGAMLAADRPHSHSIVPGGFDVTSYTIASIISIALGVGKRPFFAVFGRLHQHHHTHRLSPCLSRPHRPDTVTTNGMFGTRHGPVKFPDGADAPLRIADASK
jgi:hypothetical protein